MEDLVIFALPAKLPKEIISKIDLPNKLIAPQGKIKLKYFANTMKNYNFIIGIGNYSGKNQTNLRLEKECHKENQTFVINSFLKPIDGVIPSKDIGNSYCNHISFIISKHYPLTKYSFIHIPKRMDKEKAAEKINMMIEIFLSGKL